MKIFFQLKIHSRVARNYSEQLPIAQRVDSTNGIDLAPWNDRYIIILKVTEWNWRNFKKFREISLALDWKSYSITTTSLCKVSGLQRGTPPPPAVAHWCLGWHWGVFLDFGKCLNFHMKLMKFHEISQFHMKMKALAKIQKNSPVPPQAPMGNCRW